MTNKEVFRNYATEAWVVEELLNYLLLEYWEEIKDKPLERYRSLPINPVGFVKDFMKEETLINTQLAEKSKMDSLSSSVVFDADFTEVN